ncbi:hypothetical protein ACSHWB_16235 [Lentzea sp. HUAS TT2]|uniref:hypothetical protein n=1 Tax=Lentzea sp. HUAS TT2 TaxID=3447454 RepID=UPI003F70B13F
MTVLDASYYKSGDLVTAPWGNTQISGRVIGYVPVLDRKRNSNIFNEWLEWTRKTGRPIGSPPEHLCTFRVKVTLNRPSLAILPRYRMATQGMPTLQAFSADELHLVTHDPQWNPYAVKPYAIAEHLKAWGTYLTGQYYDPGDPVWVWEDRDWHAASVVNVNRWVSVRFENGFVDSKGNRSKSYRTYQVWPVISESSAQAKATFERSALNDFGTQSPM